MFVIWSFLINPRQNPGQGSLFHFIFSFTANTNNSDKWERELASVRGFGIFLQIFLTQKQQELFIGTFAHQYLGTEQDPKIFTKYTLIFCDLDDSNNAGGMYFVSDGFSCRDIYMTAATLHACTTICVCVPWLSASDSFLAFLIWPFLVIFDPILLFHF